VNHYFVRKVFQKNCKNRNFRHLCFIHIYFTMDVILTSTYVMCL
jgi:hypothetical protein